MEKDYYTPKKDLYLLIKQLLTSFLKKDILKMKDGHIDIYITPGWLSYQIRFFDSNRNISVGAPGNLYNAWKPMEKFLAITPLSVSQLFVYKTPFDLWLRNR